MLKVVLTKYIEGIEPGVVVAQYAAAHKGYHVYEPSRHQMHRFAVPPSEGYFVGSEYFEIFKDGSVRDDERPYYLHPIHVPGFAYHGHHIYLDDLWLRDRNVNWRTEERFKQVLSLCKKTLDQFRYPQQFCTWFCETWPEGIFLDKLAYLSETNQIPELMEDWKCKG